MSRENESFEVMTIRSEIQILQHQRDNLHNRIEALEDVLQKITQPQPRNALPVRPSPACTPNRDSF